MHIHVIRLRGAWECDPLESPGGRLARLSLPASVESLPAGRLRLTRWFNRPPRDAGSRVILRLSRCAGVRAVRFNGEPAGAPLPDCSEFEVDLGSLGARNELAIDAEPPPGETEWGVISLVFLRRSAESEDVTIREEKPDSD